MKELLERFNVRNMQLAAYHTQSDGLVDRRQQNLVYELAKHTAPSGNAGNWPAHPGAAFWADRITVRKFPGMTPYPVIFRQECLLLVKIMTESWHVVDWLRMEKAGNKRTELLALHTRQLERRPEDIEKAAKVQRKSQEANCKYFNKNRRHRPEGENHKLRGGDMALLHDTKLDTSHSHKLPN